jgi:hypothetical protein
LGYPSKVAILWFPKRFGRGLLGLLTEAFYVTKASKDPTAASIYVGYHLGRLTVNIALDLLAFGTIATYQITDPGWTSPYHVWAFRVACIVVVIVTYAVFKRFLYIALAYIAIFNPPKEAKKATPIAAPPEQHQEGT